MNENTRSVSSRRLTRQRIAPGWLVSSLALVLTLLAGCVPVQPLATNKASNETVTLRFAISAGQGSPRIDNYVHEFVDQVQALSQGKITIEPTWDAGADAPNGWSEAKVIQRVQQGEFEVGMAGSRAFDTQQITSFQPLQAPFLITNDALSAVVATSAIATKMLEHLADAGMVGLTIWPEDLRHPFSVVPDKPLLSPQDFTGMDIRTPRSDLSYQIISALGGTPMFGDGDYQGAESGLQQGGTLTGKPIATGNVTFYPKYEILFANGAAFARLTDQQRLILRQAAAATQQKAIANRPQEVDAATAYCADGGSIVLASDEQVKAFEQAAQPVFDKLTQDAFNAEMIAAIRELKASTTPSAGAAACAPTAIAPSPGLSADTQVWSAGLPPTGTWTVELSTADLVKVGLLESTAKDYSGHQIYEFQDGEGIFRKRVNNVDVDICPFTYTAVENFVRLSFHDTGLGNYHCGNDHDDVQWRLDADGLHFHLVDTTAGKVEITAIYETKPLQKVDAWSPGLPPNGVWQNTLTTDDLVQMGDLRSTAAEWAGMRTLTFQDGKFVNLFDNGHGFSAKCQANYAVVDDFVRFTFFSDTDECPGEVDDIQWRIDEEGLHLHLVAIQNSQLLENRAMYEAKPWQKVQ